MTKELLQARLKELTAAREQALANANAFSGAIQEATYWLNQIVQAEAKAGVPAPSKTQ